MGCRWVRVSCSILFHGTGGTRVFPAPFPRQMEHWNVARRLTGLYVSPGRSATAGAGPVTSGICNLKNLIGLSA